MQKFFLLWMIAALFMVNSNAQDNNYAVNSIPLPMLKNANAVRRMDEMRIVINDAGKASIYHKYAVTIFNAQGDDHARFDDYYDEFRDIKYVEGKLFDASGKKMRSMKKSELKDVSGVGNNTMSDDRVLYHDFECKAYPYTIEYESEVELKNIFHLPKWQPVTSENCSVQASTLTVQCPATYQLRYTTFNYNKVPDSIVQNGIATYKWAVEGIPAIIPQQYQPELYELTPTVFLAPSDFKIDGYTGNMDSWNNLGKFIYSLNEGRDELPENIKQAVHSLTDKLIDVHEKIKVLYEYMQKNTRYVSVQLGIGGWQPFKASYVAGNGYGDCKALSNYMFSLLKEANIKACYVLIKAGENKTDFLNNFPCTQFNHAIACVPLQKDTVWLECTSSTLPAGYLSDFTCNRDALLIDGNGGKLVHTPVYNKEYNLIASKITAILDSTGLLKLNVNTKYTGLQQGGLAYTLTLPDDKLKDYQKQEINLPSYSIDKSEYSTIKDRLPIVNEHLEITANNYAAVSGRRVFINPDILHRYDNQFKVNADRTCDIMIMEEYKATDSVEITIPDGYMAESVPAVVSFESKFGKYNCSVKVLPGKIIYYRLHETNSGRFPASDAKALADFFDKVSKADKAKVVLVKAN